jgi:hypothetical protein
MVMTLTPSVSPLPTIAIRVSFNAKAACPLLIANATSLPRTLYNPNPYPYPYPLTQNLTISLPPHYYRDPKVHRARNRTTQHPQQTQRQNC